MIHADFNDFKKGFEIHAKASSETQMTSFYLLLFYAVECGLKALYLRRRKSISTKSFAKDDLVFDHNIPELAKSVKIPARSYNANVFFKINRSKTEQYHLKDIHQAWRYHIEVNPMDEQRLVKSLESLKIYIAGVLK